MPQLKYSELPGEPWQLPAAQRWPSMGLISLLKPGHLDPLIETDLGFRLLLIGGTMLGMGLLIIRGLVKSAVKD